MPCIFVAPWLYYLHALYWCRDISGIKSVPFRCHIIVYAYWLKTDVIMSCKNMFIGLSRSWLVNLNHVTREYVLYYIAPVQNHPGKYCQFNLTEIAFQFRPISFHASACCSFMSFHDLIPWWTCNSSWCNSLFLFAHSLQLLCNSKHVRWKRMHNGYSSLTNLLLI